MEGDPIICGMLALVTILLAAAIHSFFSETKSTTTTTEKNDGIMKKKDNQKKTKTIDVFDMDGDWADDGNHDVKKTLKERVEEAPKLVMDNPKEPSAMMIKPKINKGPYKIGERIVLKGMEETKTPELNGRHGLIADVWDGERYPVDLDLPYGKVPQLHVPVSNLQKESPLVPELLLPGGGRAPVTQGCLEEGQGRICAFLFKTLRSVADGVTTSQLKIKERSPHHCWEYFQEVYPSYLEFLTRGILMKAKLADLEASIHPQNPKGTYKSVVDAVKSDQAVAGWNVRVEGQFYLVGMGPEGTMVIPCDNLRKVYCVVGYQKPLGALLGQMPRPPKVQLTLVPWYGRLIHDTMVASTSGTNQIELAPIPLTRQLAASCQAAISEGRVIYRLAQLEVKDGFSKEGVPYAKPIVTPPPSQQQQQQQQQVDFSKEPTATQEERSAVENLTELEAFHPNTPLSSWNCIRLPTSQQQQDKKKKMMLQILQGQGQKIHEVDVTTDYTALKILRSVLTIAASKMKGKRPLLLGVDDAQVVQRLRFLCQGISNLKIALLKVERKPQPVGGAATAALGGGGGGMPSM